MFSATGTKDRDRLKSGVGVAALHLIIGYAFVTGLGIDIVPRIGESLKLFDVVPPQDPPEVAPKEVPQVEEAGSTAPRATPIVAPKPLVKVDPVAQVTVATRPATGSDSSGAGSGGNGNGVGTGSGSGTGQGSKARLVSGSIRNRDYPRAASRAEAGGTVIVRFKVGIDGRARDCSVFRSSGNSALDSTTCRLVERRFRYEAARDAQGRPVESEVGWQQQWWLEPR